MAASELTVENATFNGVDATFNAANADGNYFTNNGKTFLIFRNASGGDITVTIDSQTNCNFGFDHDLSIVVNDGDDTIVPWMNQNRFNDSDGYTQITYSGVTSFTVAVINIS